MDGPMEPIARDSSKSHSQTRVVPSSLYTAIAVTCAFLMASVLVTGFYGREVSQTYFLPFHLALEILSVVVSLSVFVVGVLGYSQTKSVRDLILGVTFATAGAVDLVHALTYQGMPRIWTDVEPGTANAYWLIARVTVGLGLLAASHAAGLTKRRGHFLPYLVYFGAVAVAAAVVLVTIHGPTIGPALVSAGGGSSVLQAGLECAVIALYAAAFCSISSRNGWDSSSVIYLRGALVVAAFAELALAIHLRPFGWMCVLGHTFKALAYYLILNALFVSAVRRPYQQLSEARDELQTLYTDARAHREEVEQSLARIGAALSASLQLDEALDLIAELAGDMLHADCAVVACADKPGKDIRVAAQRGECRGDDQPVKVTLEVAKRVIEERRTILLDDLCASGLAQCDCGDDRCLQSMVCAPMIYEDLLLGVVSVYSHGDSPFEEGDVALLEGFASHAAVAIHNAISYERESHIADVLQKSFLSTTRLVTEHFEIAQVYKPAAAEALVGGDFYDVFELEDGRIGLAIGDVSGKGLRAAVHTAMAKYALRAYAHEGHSPAETMRLLSGVVGRLTDTETFITMFYGLLDPETGEMLYANAGHEPPIYACDGTYLTLPSTGPVLGLGIDTGYEEGRRVLESGCTLLLYTDGISEARKGRVMLGTEGIGEELQVCESLGGDDIAKCVHRAAIDFAGGELRDDAAILAVRSLR